MTSPLTRLNVRPDAWELVWSFAHRTLMVNLCLALAGLPLMAALGLVAEPWRYPVFFGVLALPLGPAAAAAFGFLSSDDPRPSAGVLLRSLRASGRKALIISMLAVALTLVLMADIRALAGSRAGPAVVPLLVMVTLLVVSAPPTALMLTATEPELSIRQALQLALYATVRRPHLSVLSAAVVAGAAVIVSQAPLAGLATVPGCALWVVFVNSRFQLSRLPQEMRGDSGVARSPMAGHRPR
ncbi:hypothetical protein [Kribbella sp. CA-293567]|uniref:hypothetical protein n=1 Tax=Kribbella sp. CA-293567 TaxID=3002436 RepID=UPI0022DE0258|nr:hypothetical protein [Kribbella sp. CA-293567]WBQ08351.1 hypothetical protein OX958_16420 [Kribbella sp. CA-293567]